MRNFIWKFLPHALAAFALLSCYQTDTGVENSVEVTGTLYLQNGTPAVNAEVTAYAVNYLPGNAQSGFSGAKWIARTDSGGRFLFSNVSSGQYNILGKIAASDSLFCFRDSISVSNNEALSPDTLRLPGSLTGKILLQPGDDPRTATLQVPGTDYRSSIDSSGTFILPHLGQGAYRLRVITTLPNYPPFFKGVICLSGRNDTLPQPIFPHCSAPWNHFALDSSTVALWSFDSWNRGRIKDWGAHGFDLSPPTGNLIQLLPSPHDSAMVFTGEGQFLSTPNNPLLTVGGTGKITYEARIYMDQYPSQNNFNGEGSVVGMYEGLKMQIWYDGRLQAGAQKLDNSGTGYWYPPTSDPGVVPLHRWVDVAVALDQTTGEAYGYIDGVPIQLHGDSTNMDPWRAAPSILTVGEDRMDDQQFIGEIDEIRVSDNLVLGRGLTLKP